MPKEGKDHIRKLNSEMRMRGGGGGALMFGGSHCWNFVVTIVSVTVQCPLSILHMCFY